MILDMPVLDDPAISDSHDIGGEVIDRLTLPLNAPAQPGKPAGNSKVADNAVTHEHLLKDVDASVRECLEERGPGISQPLRPLCSAGGRVRSMYAGEMVASKSALLPLFQKP